MNRIEIGFEKDSFHYETMIERENRSQLEELCRDFLKKEVKVFISSFEGEGGAKGKDEPPERRETCSVERKGVLRERDEGKPSHSRGPPSL